MQASAERHRIELTGEQKTLLIPLYAKALDYRSRRSILHDRKADEIVRSLDYDFKTLGSSGSRRILVVRSRQLDEWIRAFVARSPSSVVLNLGCGLDARYSRVAPPASVRWYDVDFPDVIALRRRFYPEPAGYRMVPRSLTDPEWLGSIEADRPGVAVADGVLGYLDPGEVTRLVRGIVDHFPSGELLFDVLSSSLLSRINPRLDASMGARLRWGVDELEKIDELDPRLRRAQVVSLFDTPYTPTSYRVLYRLLYLSSRFRRMIRLVRLEYPVSRGLDDPAPATGP